MSNFKSQIAQKLIRMFMSGCDDNEASIMIGNTEKFKSQKFQGKKQISLGSYKVHAKRIRFAFGNDTKKMREDECHVNCQPNERRKVDE